MEPPTAVETPEDVLSVENPSTRTTISISRYGRAYHESGSMLLCVLRRYLRRGRLFSRPHHGIGCQLGSVPLHSATHLNGSSTIAEDHRTAGLVNIFCIYLFIQTSSPRPPLAHSIPLSHQSRSPNKPVRHFPATFTILFDPR